MPTNLRHPGQRCQPLEAVQVIAVPLVGVGVRRVDAVVGGQPAQAPQNRVVQVVELRIPLVARLFRSFLLGLLGGLLLGLGGLGRGRQQNSVLDARLPLLRRLGSLFGRWFLRNFFGRQLFRVRVQHQPRQQHAGRAGGRHRVRHLRVRHERIGLVAEAPVAQLRLHVPRGGVVPHPLGHIHPMPTRLPQTQHRVLRDAGIARIPTSGQRPRSGPGWVVPAPVRLLRFDQVPGNRLDLWLVSDRVGGPECHQGHAGLVAVMVDRRVNAVGDLGCHRCQTSLDLGTVGRNASLQQGQHHEGEVSPALRSDCPFQITHRPSDRRLNLLVGGAADRR